MKLSESTAALAAAGLVSALGTCTVHLAATPGQEPSSGAPADPQFEVASVKLFVENGGPVAVGAPGAKPGNYFRTGMSVRALIQQAYQIPFVRQIGGPEWIREDTYRINAKIPDDVVQTTENLRVMIRGLLADRFKLVAREEERELPIYLLLFNRDDKRLGPELQRFTVDCQAPDADRQQCGSRISSRPGRIEGRNSAIGRLRDMLEFAVGRPVIDKTGLEGTYSFEITFAPEQAAASDLPSLYTALQDQLGLKLESDRGRVRVLAIDSIQRPSAD